MPVGDSKNVFTIKYMYALCFDYIFLGFLSHEH